MLWENKEKPRKQKLELPCPSTSGGWSVILFVCSRPCVCTCTLQIPCLVKAHTRLPVQSQVELHTGGNQSTFLLHQCFSLPLKSIKTYPRVRVKKKLEQNGKLIERILCFKESKQENTVIFGFGTQCVISDFSQSGFIGLMRAESQIVMA